MDDANSLQGLKEACHTATQYSRNAEAHVGSIYKTLVPDILVTGCKRNNEVLLGFLTHVSRPPILLALLSGMVNFACGDWFIHKTIFNLAYLSLVNFTACCLTAAPDVTREILDFIRQKKFVTK